MAIRDIAKAAPALASIHLESGRFDDLIAAHGVAVRYRAARRCACYQRENSRPDPACRLCYPYGYVWEPSVETVIHAPGRKPRRVKDEQGALETGDVMFTFPTGLIPTYFGRIVMPTAKVVVDDILVKGEEDTIRWSEVLAVDRADYTTRTQPTEGYEVTNHRLKIEGVDAAPDIRITGRDVTWLNAGIPDGTQYVVRFTTHPEFIVWETQDRQEGGELMPYRALCKRLDYLQHPKEGAQLAQQPDG